MTPEETRELKETMSKYSVKQLGHYLIITFKINILDLFMGSKIKSSLLELLEVEDYDFKHIIIDMRNIVSIDSTGLALLAFLNAKTKRETGGKIFLYKTNEAVNTVLRLTSMSSFFNFLDDEGLEELKRSTTID